LRYLRYAILVVLVPVFLWDSILGEKLAEVEPFKSTFLVPAWERSGPFFSWWLLLLGLSVFMYRPFCRYVCPLGGGLAILSSFRFSGPRRRRFCTSCTICTRGCEPRAIRENGSIDPRECLSCMECESNYRNQEVCPPLIGIQVLDAKGDLDPREGRKLERLKLDRERM
jgi:NosR/NirI family nitrous oxide reductase transcriptional regulator